MIRQVKSQKARSNRPPEVRYPKCKANFRVPAKPYVVECRIACPHCRARLAVTLGVRCPTVRDAREGV